MIILIEMDAFFVGALVAFGVSVPPGANTMLCVIRGRESFRSALPLIGAAAGADGLYAAGCAGGLLAAHAAGATDIIQWLVIPFLIGCAWLLWPRERTPTTSAVAVAALNPPAAILWLSLASSVGPQTSIPASIAFVVGAIVATALWFTMVALVANRASRWLTEPVMQWSARLVSVALVALALWQLMTLVS